MSPVAVYFTRKPKLIVRYTTAESDVIVSVRMINVHANSHDQIVTGIKFLDWALNLIATSTPMLFTICCVKSDAARPQQTSEDLGSSLGFIFAKVIRKFKPFRYTSVMLPINGTLVRCNLDLCGRGSFHIENVTCTSAKLFLIPEIQALLSSLTQTAKICLHLEVMKVSNLHSVQEGIFKSIGMCLTTALTHSLRSLT
ncbi:MAG: hypothetical protein ACTS5P_00950 [Candidatus Hodgkinia cicadicola]